MLPGEQIAVLSYHGTDVRCDRPNLYIVRSDCPYSAACSFIRLATKGKSMFAMINVASVAILATAGLAHSAGAADMERSLALDNAAQV